MTQETRNLELSPEIKSGRSVTGYGIVFNSVSRNLGNFKEKILPEAIEGVLEVSDVLALINHNMDKGVLARSTKGKGSLKLKVDSRGLQYNFEAPKTNLGDELIEGLTRGDIRTSSFAFTVKPTGEKWEKLPDGTALRTITKFNSIHDVSMVYHEAYEDTSVALRSLAEFEKKAVPVKVEPRKAAVKARMSDAEAARLQKEQVAMLKDSIAERLAKKGLYQDAEGQTHPIKNF